MILGGRFPLLVILVFGLIVAATKGVPWVLKQMREPIPEFPVNEVRNQRYVAPYGFPGDPGDVDKLGTVRVHGPAVSAVYSTHVPDPRYDTLPSVDAVIKVAANETVTLPDGERLGLAAIALVPTWAVLKPSDGEKREEGIFDPNGRRMSVEEVESLLMRTGLNATPLFMDTSNTGHAWKLQFVIESELDIDHFVEIRLRDSTSGGLIGGGFYPSWRPHPHEGFLLETISWPGVHPTPMALHLLVRQGEKVELEFEPVAPQLLEWEETPFELEAIYFQPRVGEPIHLVSGREDQRSLVPSFPGVTTTFTFHTMVGHGSAIRARLKDGSVLNPRVAEETIIQFHARHEDIEALQVISGPRVVHVAMELPELPGVPDQNREVSDIRDMVIPPTLVEDQRQLDGLLSSILQANRTVLVPGAVQPAFPLEVGGMTVRELLMTELGGYPQYELRPPSNLPSSCLIFAPGQGHST
jgi:hypothetical protein